MSRTLGAGLVAVVGVVIACTAADVPDVRDWAVAVTPSDEEFVLEIADDPVERARGYMFRDHVGPNEGMLFVFERSDRHGFWMKNCRVALDILWLDAGFRIVEQLRDQQPCPETGECPSITPTRPGRYVLELAAGSAERVGLRDGDTLVILWEGASK